MLLRQKENTALNKTPKHFPKDLKHHRVKLTSELGEQTQSITKSYWGWKYCMLSLASKCIPFVPSYRKKSPINASPPVANYKKPNHKSVEQTRADVRPQWCASGWLPFAQQWVFPRILYTENVNWLSLANGHTEPYFGCRKQRSTSLSIKQDHLDGQHKTAFFFQLSA